jgi:hypothetical protein
MAEAAQSDPIEYFTDDELRVLAGLLLLILRADGTATAHEHRALRRLARRVRLGPNRPDGSPYRSSPGSAEAASGDESTELLARYLEVARRELADRDACLQAAFAIGRADAREAMYVALYDLAASDIIASPEWELLELLAKNWQLEVGAAQGG